MRSPSRRFRRFCRDLIHGLTDLLLFIPRELIMVPRWIWHDIRPSYSGAHHRHHRSWLRRRWDGFCQPFVYMYQDIRRSIHSSSDDRTVYHHRSNLLKRMWHGFCQPFVYMYHDIHSDSDMKPSIGQEARYAIQGAVEGIRTDLKFRVNKETLAQTMYILLMCLIAMRVVAVWKTCNITGLDPYYTYRHVIFTLVWGILFFFFFNLFLLKRVVSPLVQNLKDMERASLMAFIACIIKFLTSSVYIFFNRIAVAAFNWATAYYIGELLIWFMLSIFLFYYWRNRVSIRKKAQLGKFEA